MKLILSRKGFDSSSGGVPSPMFPDGAMISLPIPDKVSTVAYRDIAGSRWASIGQHVEQLAHRPAAHRARLDPDLNCISIPRAHGWRPLFGQKGAAESHLRNLGVGTGDVFLFFGLFRSVEKGGDGWRYVRGSRPVHVIFGWLQIADRISVANWPADHDWAFYHPHFQHGQEANNALYTAPARLSLPGLELAVAGAGVFPCFAPRLRLTAPDSSAPSTWLLPEWFYPEGRDSALSYNGDLSRWRRCNGGVILAAAPRGQEFVLDCGDYPEAICWVKTMLEPCGWNS